MVAVLRELKKREHAAEIRFWCDHKFAPQARGIIGNFDAQIPVQTILSGKLRRYHNVPLWRQLLRPVSIVLPNIRDIVLMVCGIAQSFTKLIIWRPDVVFTKGGFVCLPVGIAARLLHIPLVIHDSDATAGLTSRILAKWATAIATGAELKHYPYPESISRYVGTPVRSNFKPFSENERRSAKDALGLDQNRPLVVVTGGGLGAKRINDAVAISLHDLLDVTSVILISGTAQYDELRALTPQDDPRFQLHAFVNEEMITMLGAADVVVARAGATTILELAALAKPTILVPNGFLTGGHQLKNAAAYAESGAVEVMNDDELHQDPQLLVQMLRGLLSDKTRLKQLGAAFHKFAKPNAAKDMADMIVAAAK